jgi:hypothetical protein
MAGADNIYDDDDGFLGYVPVTVDPGNALLIATIIFCLLTNLILPCLVSLGRRYERKRIAREQAERIDGVVSEQPQTDTMNATSTNNRNAKNDASALDQSSHKLREEGDTASASAGKNYIPESYVRGDQQKNSSTWKSLLDQVRA